MPNLRLVGMPTDDEIDVLRRRRAWWIAAARRADPRQPTLAAVATAVGLKVKSASTVSDWENAIGGGPSMSQLERLAAYYRLPLSTFTEPRPTEQEVLDSLRDLSRAAVELGTEDSADEREPGLAAGDTRDESPRRRSA